MTTETPDQTAQPPKDAKPGQVASGGDGPSSPDVLDKVTRWKKLLLPQHDPNMANSNYYIDRRAWVLALGVLGCIGICTWFVNFAVGQNMPDGVPVLVSGVTPENPQALQSPPTRPLTGQGLLVKEVNRQLEAWLSLSHNYETLAMLMGATAAALTVLVGFIKEHTKSKMFLMAMSAALSVFIGTVNPAEKSTRFLNSWRVLYAEVNAANAKNTLTEDDYAKLATALSVAESALSQKLESGANNGPPPKGEPPPNVGVPPPPR